MPEGWRFVAHSDSKIMWISNREETKYSTKTVTTKVLVGLRITKKKRAEDPTILSALNLEVMKSFSGVTGKVCMPDKTMKICIS